MSARRYTLRAGALELDVLPAVGGSIARFDVLGPEGRQPLLRGTKADYTDVLDAACFPLLPFVNRIRGGSFECDGRKIHLASNLAGDASPLHGQGWRAAWSVESVQDDQIELVYQHHASDWPWRYESRQRIVLLPGGLLIELSCRNLSVRPMPCGLGLHPCFPCTQETLLDTEVMNAWTADADNLPLAKVAATGRYALRRRLVCAQGLDNGFDGWGGAARIAWPERGLVLQFFSADAAYFQLYSPLAGGFFAAEPAQHANAALNAPQHQWEALGIRLLAPGESRRLTVRFTASWVQRP